MKIFIGADHRGFILKSKIIKLLESKGHVVVDVGVKKQGVVCDYPKISLKLGVRVAQTKRSRGILVCMTGLGHSIAANKIPGIRAALCYNKKAAYFSRAHNDSNVLVLGALLTSKAEIPRIINTWLATSFEGGRHLRRVNQIKNIEKKFCSCTKG